MLKQSTHGEVTRFDLARTLWGRGHYWTTAYLVGTTLIDSGCAHTASELLTALDGRRIRRIINTNSHEDHIGGNSALQRLHPDLEVVAHPAALRVLGDPRREQPLHPYRKLMWGWPEKSSARHVTNREELEDGTYRFQIIYTPGHSDDHICVRELKHNWIFSGDLFVGGYDRGLGQGGDIWRIIASLKLIAALKPTVLYPGSARQPADPLLALNAKITYYEQLGEDVLRLANNGLSERKIMRQLCGLPMWIEILTLGHFARWHLIRSFLKRGPQR